MCRKVSEFWSCYFDDLKEQDYFRLLYLEWVEDMLYIYED